MGNRDDSFASSEQQLSSECVGRIIKPILTTDSRPDSEDSEEESHVESTTTNTTGRKRTAGNMAVHDVRITVRFASSYSGTALFQNFELRTPHLLQILGQTRRTAKKNHLLKAQLPTLLAEKG